jgi:hypothetical protein
MKKAVAILLAVMVLATSAALASAPYLGAQQPTKPPSEIAPVPPHAQVGGDTFGSATVIGGLPYVDSDTSCRGNDDYDVPCIGALGAPDLVYSFTPATNTCVRVQTCGSTYDTALHIYANNLANLVACNDDNCGLQSLIDNVALAAGVTYYIVVDGFSTACGDYTLQVTECPPPCNTQCPPGAIQENEPDCRDQYDDHFNGGCNSTPPVFSDLPCNDLGVTVCGRYGTFIGPTGGSFRDTDWYRIVIDHPVILDYCLCGSAVSAIFVINGNHPCPVTTPDILCSATGPAGQQICCSVPLAPGTYYLFAGTNTFTGVPCGSPYTFTVHGYECPPVAANPAGWSQVKTMYR